MKIFEKTGFWAAFMAVLVVIIIYDFLAKPAGGLSLVQLLVGWWQGTISGLTNSGKGP